jgi:hypothetical protein
MNGIILTYLAIYVSIVGGLLILSIIVGSFIYDLRANKLSGHNLKEIKRAKKPLVSVLLIASDNQAEMELTINSILASSYKKISVIIATNSQKVTSKFSVKNLKNLKDENKLSVRSTSKFEDDDEMILSIVNKQAETEIILVARPGSMIDKNLIENAVIKLAIEPNTAYIKPKFIPQIDSSLLSRMESYFGFIASQILKLLDLIGYLRPRDDIFVARKSYFAVSNRYNNVKMFRDISPAPQRVRYASSVKVYSVSNGYLQTIYKKIKPLNIVINPMQLAMSSLRSKLRVSLMAILLLLSVVAIIASPFIIAYFVYLATRLHEPTLLIATAIALIALLISSISSDDNIKFMTKLKYILGMPISFYWFYLSLVFVSIKFAASFILEIFSHVDVRRPVRFN